MGEAVTQLLRTGGPAGAVAVIAGAFFLWAYKDWMRRMEAKDLAHKEELDKKDAIIKQKDEQVANLAEQRVHERGDTLDRMYQVVADSTEEIRAGGARDQLISTALAGVVETQKQILSTLVETQKQLALMQQQQQQGRRPS